MTVTFGVTVTTEGGGAANAANATNTNNATNVTNATNAVNNNGRRVLMAKTDSVSNVNNNNNNNIINNNNNNGSAANASITGKASVLSVRRVLFGPPADPAETRAWLDRQLCAATAADSQSWNFDFVNERPLRDSPADRYAWERVCPPQHRVQASSAADSTTVGQQQDCRRNAAIKPRQSKVTDFMATKKRPLSIAGSLRSNKIADEELGASANKRSRRSVATMAI